MKDFVINSQSISPGECKQIALNSYELHTKTKIEIPVFVFRSKKTRPTLLLSAGMHGEETNGIDHFWSQSCWNGRKIDFDVAIQDHRSGKQHG